VDGSGNGQMFVASEVHGTWGAAQEVPGTASLDADGFASMGSASCAPAGTSRADVFYQPSSAPVLQAFAGQLRDGKIPNRAMQKFTAR
jgi:hypothetical protein